MSLQSWKEEFYPVDASEVKKEDALAHSLKKWIGLRYENLERHNVARHGSYLEDGEYSFMVTADSCALCAHYLTPKPGVFRCGACPLAEAIGASCDQELVVGIPAPYFAFTRHGNPEPMIMHIEHAIKLSRPKHVRVAEALGWVELQHIGKRIVGPAHHLAGEELWVGKSPKEPCSFSIVPFYDRDETLVGELIRHFELDVTITVTGSFVAGRGGHEAKTLPEAICDEIVAIRGILK